ncbi:MAG: VCBS repeat-containing protein, partial [Gammaproteobacteria bacterium]|nr:VCBS repeat-containing protein [Gammaproteobacteria bacterium]
MTCRRKLRYYAIATWLAAPGVVAGDWFEDATRESGLDFVHFNGMSGELYFPEMVGAGGALLDFDGDGDLDLYLVQGHMLGNKNLSTAVFPPQHPVPLSDRLYRNQLEGGRLRFTDVTRATGVEVAQGYGMGAASGDIDNDGDPDLYITNFGDNQLLLNTGGRFRDATAEYAVNDSGWSVSAAFADIDGDSWLDLYVGNYVDYDLANPRICLSAAVVKEYCGPASFTVQPD